MTRKYLYAVVFGIWALLAAGRPQTAPAQPRTTAPFARQISDLSEPGGNFDTDNLISNERSYLHVVPALKQRGASGGAYVGVGPDQNFSYIAASRPAIAFIIDVRRDNLLLHLLFKALFELSDTRADYLSHLFGRRLPSPPDQWRQASLERMVAALDAVASPNDDLPRLDKQIEAQIAMFGLPLSRQDVATIARFHHTFIDAGLSLKFQSFGRAPRSYYPTYRELLYETDRQGRRANFLVSEDDYQFVRGLQQRDLIIPVVGNLAGPTALASIGRAIRQRGETLSVLYASNVELYLFQGGLFQRFADTVSGMPRNARSLLIRSVFSGPGVGILPDTLPGYASASVTQPLDEFVRDNAAHKYLTYAGLLSGGR
jgi:hypothetical protein